MGKRERQTDRKRKFKLSLYMYVCKHRDLGWEIANNSCERGIVFMDLCRAVLRAMLLLLLLLSCCRCRYRCRGLAYRSS